MSPAWLKTTNARKGIKTKKALPQHLTAAHGLKTTNARKGIKTGQHCGAQSKPYLLKTTNARKGIKTMPC